MAKNAKGSKAEAIRQYLTENPKAGAKDVMSALNAKGVQVSENHVYFVKSKLSQRKKRQKREQAVATTKSVGIPNAAQAVTKVKTLARELGGLKNLKQLVDVLAE